MIFGLEEFRKTRFGQELIAEAKMEAKLEAKLEIIPRLLSKGLSVEKVAEILKLTPEQVQEYVNKMN